MRPTRGRTLVGVGIVVALVGLATVAYVGYERLQSGQVSAEIQPEFVTPLGADGSLTNVDVGFPWTGQGYCAGQFQVKATETGAQIRVGAVMSRTYSYGLCAGIGSNGRWATAPLTLHAPIGKRSVVRESDGAALPVFALTVMLRCQDAISSQANPGSDQTSILNEVALPDYALQANRSGEADQSARLFAKAGLEVAAGSNLMLSVPEEWMGRLSIGWGSPAIRTMNLYVTGCHQSGSGNRWLIFAGGFWVSEPSCVPIVVHSGTQQQTVQVGVGTACPGQTEPRPGT